MKLILAQPAIKRFQWELEVLLTNIKQFGEHEVILLFTKHDDSVPKYLTDKYGVRCFVYRDNRIDKSYIPSVRPYLLWQYLKNDPKREEEQYFYIDSDIIFREWPDLKSLGASSTQWFGSDCSGYIDYEYLISRRNGAAIVDHMANLMNITPEDMKGVPGIGAHILMTNPKAEFWRQAYYDSNTLYHYLEPLDSDIQKWTAEMWAQLWGMVRDGLHPSTNPELNFSMATDPIEMWEQKKIMHNAGVTNLQERDMFFKGIYVEKTPFDEDLSFVRRDKMSWKYVQAIQSVVK